MIKQPLNKPSGLAWAPLVPTHWTVKKLGFLALLKSGDSITTDDIKDDAPYPVYGGNGLRGYTERFTHGGEYALIGRQGALCGNINYAKGEFWASEHAVVVDPREQVVVRWLGELLRAMELNQYSVSAAQPGLSVETIAALKVPVPPLKEQRAIADFLDREAARLDALVAAKERVLGLLAEKRRARVTRAVTRGLDPRAPLRDSGIPWLGEIPAHWSIIPLKHACSLIKDGTHLPPERTMMGIPLLSVRNVVGETFRTLPDDSLIDEEDYEVLCRAFRIERNDVLLAIVGATLGKVAVVGDMPRFHIQRSLAAFRANPKLLDFNYLASCLRSDWFQAILWESVSFSAQPGLYLGSLRDFVVTRPPLEEQRAIAARVSTEAYKWDAIQSAIEHTITLLKERRAALIAAAVTGQIDVEAAA